MSEHQPFLDIHRVLGLYLDGIHNGDVDVLERVMHRDCRMVCVSDGTYSNLDMREYFNLVAQRESPRRAGEPREDAVHSVLQVNDEVASVRLSCRVLGKHCEDLLTLVNHEHRWQIISKVFAFEYATPTA